MESQIQNVNIEKIIPNRFQPRLSFDENALQSLAESIKEHGIIQPLVVRRVGDKFEIIAGERRYKAASLVGLTEVPVIVTNLDDNKSAEVALVENVQRKNLSSIEEAKSYKKILDKENLSQEQLAQKLGVSQPTIANKMRLLNLSDEVQQALMNDKISERHARSLLQINDPDKQVNMLHRVINERMTVRQLDDAIKELLINNPSLKVKPVEALNVNPEEEKANSKDIIPSSDSILNLFAAEKKNNSSSLEDMAANLDIGSDEEFNPFKKTSEEKFEALDIPEEDNVALPSKENTPVAKPVVQDTKFKDIDEIKEAYEKLNKKVEDSGFKITSEDFDFNDLYQIIIKIDKQAE